RIEIYNIAGQRVAVLFDGYRQPGYYEVEVDARQLASGIYFYRMVAGSFQAVKRMVLLK
ncbi:MAG: T9SS C-terminal target domain-containing protein, partial [Calditrichaeota bacterium]